MTLIFGIIGALAWLSIREYEEKTKRKLGFHDEERMMYMAACIITAVVALLSSIVCIVAGTWGGVTFCLFVTFYSGMLACMFYIRAHK